MRFLVLLLLVIGVVLWIERYYWKRRAHLLELRLLGRERSDSVNSLFDAWLDGRIESSLRKKSSQE